MHSILCCNAVAWEFMSLPLQIWFKPKFKSEAASCAAARMIRCYVCEWVHCPRNTVQAPQHSPSELVDWADRLGGSVAGGTLQRQTSCIYSAKERRADGCRRGHLPAASFMMTTVTMMICWILQARLTRVRGLRYSIRARHSLGMGETSSVHS